MQPKVTVVIPCYNAEKTIGHAIRSVLRQTVQDFDVVIVDDASQDGTHRIVRSFAGSRVRVLQHELNRGPAAARNTAFEAAKGEWICVLDADDILASDYIEVMLAHASNYSNSFLACDIGVFFGNGKTPRPWRTVFRSADTPITGDLVVPWFASFIDFGIDVKPFFPGQVTRDFAIRQQETAMGSEWLEFIGEMYRVGFQLVLINKPLYYYRSNGANYSSRYEQVEEDIESCDRLLSASWISEDVRRALRKRRIGLTRHLPWKALHRKRYAKAIGGFLRHPGSLLQGISLARLEFAKMTFKRTEVLGSK